MDMDFRCPLCGAASAGFLSADGRDYRRCGRCALTFVPESQHADEARERARYAEHRNSPDDSGYRDFLDRLLAPLAAVLPVGAEGLDFGCGPGPAAATMMRARGFAMTDYDPYFAPDPAALARSYDFVVSTEVLEHLRRPGETLALIDGLLRRGGVLGAMTGVLEDDAAFAGWWYRKDFTHIAFYRPETLSWIARRFGWRLTRPSRDAALFAKV
jgi:SAM-dependent methyltransferase